MYDKDYDEEILWRKEFPVLTGAIFIVGFIICAVIGFLFWNEYQYQYFYGPNLFEASTPASISLLAGLIGGYIFFSLLSGIMFTIHALSKKHIAIKIVMTILFILPILLILLGILYSIPYAIYNIIKLIILKSKKRNMPVRYRVKPAYPNRYTNNVNIPSSQPPQPYNNAPTPIINNESPFINSNINNNISNQAPYQNTDNFENQNHSNKNNEPTQKPSSSIEEADINTDSPEEKLLKRIDDCLNELDELLIYEKPYDKPGIKRTDKKEETLANNTDDEIINKEEEKEIEKEIKEEGESKTDNISSVNQQESLQNSFHIYTPASTADEPFTQSTAPFRSTSRPSKDPENPYGDDFSSMM